MGLLVVRPDNSLNEAIQNAANTIFNAWYKKYLLDLQHQQEL
ncbi:hypothetical protein HG1285_12917, partial [Hydrogenivirga sp. 128-5-R1-1]